MSALRRKCPTSSIARHRHSRLFLKSNVSILMLVSGWYSDNAKISRANKCVHTQITENNTYFTDSLNFRASVLSSIARLHRQA